MFFVILNEFLNSYFKFAHSTKYSGHLFFNKLLSHLVHNFFPGMRHDKIANTAPVFNYLCIQKRLIGMGHRVGIDPHKYGRFPQRGNFMALFPFSGCNAVPHLIRYLLVYSLGGVKLHNDFALL